MRIADTYQRQMPVTNLTPQKVINIEYYGAVTFLSTLTGFSVNIDQDLRFYCIMGT